MALSSQVLKAFNDREPFNASLRNLFQCLIKGISLHFCGQKNTRQDSQSIPDRRFK